MGPHCAPHVSSTAAGSAGRPSTALGLCPPVRAPRDEGTERTARSHTLPRPALTNAPGAPLHQRLLEASTWWIPAPGRSREGDELRSPGHENKSLALPKSRPALSSVEGANPGTWERELRCRSERGRDARSAAAAAAQTPRGQEWERGRRFCFTSHSHFPAQPSRVLRSGLETPFPNMLASTVGSRISAPSGSTLTPPGVQSAA